MGGRVMKYLMLMVFAVTAFLGTLEAKAGSDGYFCTVSWNYYEGDIVCEVHVAHGGNYPSKRAARRACWAQCEAVYSHMDEQEEEILLKSIQ